MSNELSLKIKATIKKIMKNKSLTYKDLAEHLSLSEVSIKRMMTKGEISIERLADVCRFLEVPVSKLIELSEGVDDKLLDFTDKQEAFFDKNSSYLTVFNELQDGLGPKEIVKKYGLKPGRIGVYLKKLDKIGLIEYISDTKVRFKKNVFHVWKKNGILSQKYSIAIPQKTFDLIHDSYIKREKFSYGHGFTHYLTKESCAEFNQEMSILFSKYAERSGLQVKLFDKKNLILLTGMAMAGAVPTPAYVVYGHPK